MTIGEPMNELLRTLQARKDIEDGEKAERPRIDLSKLKIEKSEGRAWADPIAELERLGLLGFDVSLRRHSTNWPAPYRVRLLASKNERDEFRVTAYGTTLHEAVTALLEVSKR